VVVVRPHHQGTVRRGVLVGSDGTPTSLPVLEHAYRHASVHDQPVTVLLALWDRTAVDFNARLLPDVEDEVEQARLLLAETISGLAEKFPDVHVETVIRRGDPADALVELAERSDLVVLGRHERRGLQRLLEGSTTAAVVERAHAPVAVVPVGTPA
jgi:nucleotide-binding universal stress UspA family protein